jgi:hypothetical protein
MKNDGGRRGHIGQSQHLRRNAATLPAENDAHWKGGNEVFGTCAVRSLLDDDNSVADRFRSSHRHLGRVYLRPRRLVLRSLRGPDQMTSGLDERVHDSGASAALIRACEQVVLAPECQAVQRCAVAEGAGKTALAADLFHRRVEGKARSSARIGVAVRERRIHLKTRLAFSRCRRERRDRCARRKASSTILLRSSRLQVRRRSPAPVVRRH